jgi:hypothetical protein
VDNILLKTGTVESSTAVQQGKSKRAKTNVPTEFETVGVPVFQEDDIWALYFAVKALLADEPQGA